MTYFHKNAPRTLTVPFPVQRWFAARAAVRRRNYNFPSHWLFPLRVSLRIYRQGCHLGFLLGVRYCKSAHVAQRKRNSNARNLFDRARDGGHANFPLSPKQKRDHFHNFVFSPASTTIFSLSEGPPTSRKTRISRNRKQKRSVMNFFSSSSIPSFCNDCFEHSRDESLDASFVLTPLGRRGKKPSLPTRPRRKKEVTWSN